MENEEREQYYKPLQITFPGVHIGTETYAVIEKSKYQLEELENTWVIKEKPFLSPSTM